MVPLPRFAGADARRSRSRGRMGARALPNSDVERPVIVARIERSEIRERSRSFNVAPGFHERHRAALRADPLVQPGLPRRKREAERRQTQRQYLPARKRRAGRATERAACAALSALGRARLPAFHHGSAQGVCSPLVRSGPGFVGKPSKGRGSLRRRPAHFQRRTSHAGRSAGRHDARTARERS